MTGLKHINAYLEIIIFLLREGDWKKTKEIQDYLTTIGVFDGNSPSSDRRLLNEYLRNLEYSGYILAKFEEDELKGRKSQEWKINERAFKTILGLTKEETYAFFTTFNFLPDNYKTLPFFKKLQGVLKKLSSSTDEDLEDITKNTFKYVPEFHEKFAKINQNILDTIYDAILNKIPLRLDYKGKILSVYPVGVFLYNGLLYLKIFDLKTENFDYKLLKLDCINSVSKMNQNSIENSETLLRIKRNIYKDTTFMFDEEKPFFFAIDIEKRLLGCSSINDFRFLNTQIYIEKISANKLRVYAVGFTGWRFASRILVPYILKFYEPDKNILNIVKKHKKDLEQKYSNLDFTIKENKRRYNEFKKTYKTILDERKKAI